MNDLAREQRGDVHLVAVLDGEGVRLVLVVTGQHPLGRPVLEEGRGVREDQRLVGGVALVHVDRADTVEGSEPLLHVEGGEVLQRHHAAVADGRLVPVVAVILAKDGGVAVAVTEDDVVVEADTGAVDRGVGQVRWRVLRGARDLDGIRAGVHHRAQELTQVEVGGAAGGLRDAQFERGLVGEDAVAVHDEGEDQPVRDELVLPCADACGQIGERGRGQVHRITRGADVLEPLHDATHGGEAADAVVAGPVRAGGRLVDHPSQPLGAGGVGGECPVAEVEGHGAGAGDAALAEHAAGHVDVGASGGGVLGDLGFLEEEGAYGLAGRLPAFVGARDERVPDAVGFEVGNVEHRCAVYEVAVQSWFQRVAVRVQEPVSRCVDGLERVEVGTVSVVSSQVTEGDVDVPTAIDTRVEVDLLGVVDAFPPEAH